MYEQINLFEWLEELNFQPEQDINEECEYMTALGCKARDFAKQLMLQEMIESHSTELEMCKNQCCKGCDNVCGYRCGRC